MSYDVTNPLILFLSNVDIFMIIVVRILGLVIILPVLSATNIPLYVKILFSITTAYMIFLSGRVEEIYYYDTFAGYAMLIAKEFLVGFTIGFVVYLIYSTIFLAGQMIDYQIGISMVSIFDPVTQLQVPISGNVIFLFMTALFIQSGALNAFISAMFFSYDVLPPGTAVFLSNGRVISELFTLITSYFIIGVKISMPIVGSILVIDVALGMLVKAAPQMNIFVVGMPIKLSIGLFILYFIVPSFAAMQDYLFDEAYRSFINMMGGLAPR